MKSNFDEVIKIYITEEQERIIKNLTDDLNYAIKNSNREDFESIRENLEQIQIILNESFEKLKSEILSKLDTYKDDYESMKNYIDSVKLYIAQELEQIKKEIKNQMILVIETTEKEINKMQSILEKSMFQMQEIIAEHKKDLRNLIDEILNKKFEELKTLENEKLQLIKKFEFLLKEMNKPWYKKINLFKNKGGNER